MDKKAIQIKNKIIYLLSIGASIRDIENDLNIRFRRTITDTTIQFLDGTQDIKLI